MREPETHLEVLLQAMEHATTNGFSVLGLDHSPIKGPEGNIEFLMHVQRSESPTALDEGIARDLVRRAHENP